MGTTRFQVQVRADEWEGYELNFEWAPAVEGCDPTRAPPDACTFDTLEEAERYEQALEAKFAASAGFDEMPEFRVVEVES